MASPLDFYLITDLHHYGEALGTSGTAYDRVNAREQKCLAETGAIIDAYFDKLIADTDTKIVLIDGDLTNDGAMESHLDLLPRLQRLKDAGKDIYLITATHDYYVEGNNTGMAKKCVGDKTVPATNTSREELFDMYFEYGLNKALSIDRESHSYCVKLQDGYRLLCLNDDGDRVFCGYSENQLKWIEQQIDEAHTAGDYIFAMTHHPTLPPSAIYPLISARDMLGDWDKTTTFLADKGIEVMFTGHTHMQNIAKKVTAKGNVYYDVNTSSMVGYPSCIRKVHIDDKAIDIKTQTIDDFDWDRKSLSVDEYLRHHFLFFLNDILDSAADDIDHLAELGSGFSMTKEQVYKLKVPLHIIGKGLKKWTFGSLGRFFLISRKIPDSIKNVKIRDFLLEVLQNVYRGNEPYSPDTPEYQAFSAIIDCIVGKLSHFKKFKDLHKSTDLIKQALYNKEPDDYELVIERKH